MKILKYEVGGIPYLSNGSGATEGLVVMAVLTTGEVGDYCVYVGIVPLYWRGDAADYAADKAEKAVWVSHWGQKLYWRAALTYFPFLPEEKYRD